MNTSSKQGSALMVAMMICGIIMIIALYLFEKVIPISSATKNIENSNAAYYQAVSAIEETKTHLSPSDPGTNYLSGTLDTNPRYWKTSTVAQGPKIPLSGQWNSEYNKDYNRIALGQPVQLVLKSLSDVNSVTAIFKTFSGTTLSGSLTSSGIIAWTLNNGSDTLISNTGGLIKGADILGVTLLDIETLDGITGTGVTYTLWDFYTAYCDGSIKICTLKFLIIEPLINDKNNPIPYLEYKLDFGGTSIPQQYTTITAEGYAPGFKQTIIKKLQQATTNEALDFTVFQ